MATREDVYKAIDSERNYQDSLKRRTLPNNTIGDYNVLLREYLRCADAAWCDNAGVDATLEVVRKIAGIGVRAMEQLGIVSRTAYGLNSFSNGYREDVYEALDDEREYQNQKWGSLDDRNSVGDFLTYMLELSRESDSLSNPDYPERSLDIIRKLTGVAVACMEKFGAPLRQEPDYAKPTN